MMLKKREAEAAVGSLHLDAWGYCSSVFGIIAGTACPEIAAWIWGRVVWAATRCQPSFARSRLIHDSESGAYKRR